MLSVGRFAKIAQITPRTVRHYESLGLISATRRGENNYRYYNRSLVKKVVRIRELQSLGFSLDEIQSVLKVSQAELIRSLEQKLMELNEAAGLLQERRSRLESALSVAKKIDSQELIHHEERKNFMEAIVETLRGEIVESLRIRYGAITDHQLGFIERDRAVYGALERRALIEAIKSCVAFAKNHQLTLGPGRGSSPSSMALFALGFSQIDPSLYGLIPERLSDREPDIHIDVEFERGQGFVDYCKEISAKLPFGRINAFKMPLIDIVKNVQQRLGVTIDFQKIEDNSEQVLSHFHSGKIEKIFGVDMSPDSLVMKYENHLPGYSGSEKIVDYLLSQKIYSFRDVVNITAVWRPNSTQMLQRIARYKQAKEEKFSYEFLAPALIKMLEPNFGLILYHEELIQIMEAYSGWSLERCNILRNAFRFNRLEGIGDLEEFRRIAPPEVLELILEEGPWAFCQPHAIAFSQFTKQTAILKSLYQETYYREIERFEAKHGLKWDDIGIRIKGVSLLQN